MDNPLFPKLFSPQVVKASWFCRESKPKKAWNRTLKAERGGRGKFPSSPESQGRVGSAGSRWNSQLHPSIPALPGPGAITTCHFPYLLHPRQNSCVLFLLPAHLSNALGSILLREESSSPGMNQDFSRSLRDVGCLHPHKQERWPFPRAPWHEHNFPGRDAKAQEFTPRMSCFPISRSRLTRRDGNGCGRTGTFTDQLCRCCRCSGEAVPGSSPSPGSTCSRPFQAL